MQLRESYFYVTSSLIYKLLHITSVDKSERYPQEGQKNFNVTHWFLE